MGCSVFVKCVVGFALKRLSQLKMYSSFIPEKLIPPRALKFDYSIIIINDWDTLVSPIILNLLYESQVYYRRNRELNWTFLSIFSQRKIFYTLKRQWFFLISFYSFEGVRSFWVELCVFFYKLRSATNQLLLCVTESDIGQGPLNHTPILYELLPVTYIELW